MHIIDRYEPEPNTNPKVCSCCKFPLHNGYVLSTGKIIDNYCKRVFDLLAFKTEITEQEARALVISKGQAEFFGVEYILPTPKVLTEEERQEADKQAMQDEVDLFG